MSNLGWSPISDQRPWPWGIPDIPPAPLSEPSAPGSDAWPYIGYGLAVGAMGSALTFMAISWMMFPVTFVAPVAFLSAMFGRKSRWVALGGLIGLLPGILAVAALWWFLRQPLF